MSAVAPPRPAPAPPAPTHPAQAALRTRPGGGVRPATVLAVLVGVSVVLGFIAYRAWQAAAGPPIIWSDSLDYARSAVWAGSRPPLLPALLAITPTFGWFAAVRAAFGVLTWSALAWVVAVRLPPQGTPSRPAPRSSRSAQRWPVVRWDQSSSARASR